MSREGETRETKGWWAGAGLSNEPYKMNSCVGNAHPGGSVLQSSILIRCVLQPFYSPILCVLGQPEATGNQTGGRRWHFLQKGTEEPRENKLGSLRDEEYRVADLEGGLVSKSRLSPGVQKL